MLTRAVVLMTLVMPLALTEAPLAAQQAMPAAPEATPPAAPTPAAAPAAPAAPTATRISASAMASDPRMIAALRHANARADIKCGVGVGAIVDLATKAEAQRCRRRMLETARLDAESDIEGH